MNANGYQLITGPEDLRAAVESLSKQSVLGLDTETTGLDPYRGRLRLVQLSAPDGVRVIDLFRFSHGDVLNNEALAPLEGLLSSLRPVKIAHNAKFDAKWLKLKLGVEVGGLFDTLLASQLISAGDPDERQGLDAVAARYLNESVDKSERLSDWSAELSEAQLQYAARDASILIPLRERLLERLKADALFRCAQLEFECVMPVAAMELAGFFLDEHRWREQIVSVEHQRVRLADELQEMLSEGAVQGSLFGRAEINLDSHVQLTDALKRLGVPLPDSTRNWKLQPLAAQYPVVAKLLEYRTVQKAITSYGENILSEISPVTKRIHADFRQIGAPTGRFSCLAGETMVSTPSGSRRMDALAAGDFVRTRYGFRRVEMALMTGTRQLYRVRLRDGRRIRSTADHGFLAGPGQQWKRLDELAVGDFLYVPRLGAFSSSGGETVSARRVLSEGAVNAPAPSRTSGIALRFASDADRILTAVEMGTAFDGVQSHISDPDLIESPSGSAIRPVAIESIVPDGVEEVYDISVHEAHEFIANGIVVHNCTNPNIQQVPHAVEYRRCFRADPPGKKLVIADYSQIELRILAEFSGDRGFIDAFQSGADLHRVTASQVFNVPLDRVTADQRSFAKRLNFGVVYGIGAQRFAMMTGLKLTDAEDVLRRYFATYRQLDAWLRDAASRAVRERSARTASGRLARFRFDAEDRQAVALVQRNGKNTPIQGTSADILKRALRLLHDGLRGTTARIVNIVHDEIVVEADAAEAEQIARIVENGMCTAGEEYVKQVPVKVETEVADEWVK